MNLWAKTFDNSESRSELNASQIADCDRIICQHLHSKQKVSAEALREALTTIENLGDANYIYTVTQLCCYFDLSVRKQAWRTIEKLLELVPVEALTTISYEMRKLRINVIEAQNSIDSTFPTKVLGLLSFNHSGYVREAAIQELVKRFDGSELSFIILRAHDWIPTIHVLATRNLEKRTTPQYANYLVKNLSLLRRLWHSGRHTFGRLQSDIENLVLEALDLESLSKILNCSDRNLSHYIYNLCLASSGMPVSDKNNLVKIGLSTNDFRIQQIAADTALKEFSNEKLGTFIPELLKHHLPTVRTETLRWVVEKKWEGFQETLKAGLFDKSTSVRTLAQFCLRNTDRVSLYEENLREQRYSIESTLRGLIELKAKVPKETVESYLNNQSGKVRAASLALLLQDAPVDAPQLVMRALTDQSSSCAKEAFKYLRRNREVLSAEMLWDVLNSDTTTLAKRIAVSLIARLPKWQSLEYLVRAKSLAKTKLQTEEQLHAHVDFCYSVWLRKYNSSFISLTQEQYDRCSKAIRENREALGPELCETLESRLAENLKL